MVKRKTVKPNNSNLESCLGSLSRSGVVVVVCVSFFFINQRERERREHLLLKKKKYTKKLKRRYVVRDAIYNLSLDCEKSRARNSWFSLREITEFVKKHWIRMRPHEEPDSGSLNNSNRRAICQGCPKGVQCGHEHINGRCLHVPGSDIVIEDEIRSALKNSVEDPTKPDDPPWFLHSGRNICFFFFFFLYMMDATI